jgi:putative DNA primase/helicase
MCDPLPTGSRKVVPPCASEWRIILPLPEAAPAPPAKHPKLGVPAKRWEYRDDAGRVLGYVCRFNVPGGGKEIRSLVFAESKKWGRQWRWLGFPKPRPLYGLDRLAARPGAPVVICEGEKAADAATVLLPDYVGITSPGGSKAVKAADWSAVAGHPIAVIWRDADEPGQAYARDVCDKLAGLSPAPAIAVVKPPEGVGEGWDAADALAEGWTPAQAAALIAAAAPASAEAASASRSGKSGTREWLLDLLGEAELWHDPELSPMPPCRLTGTAKITSSGRTGSRTGSHGAPMRRSGSRRRPRRLRRHYGSRRDWP